MELVARVLITVKDNRWEGWMKEERPNAVKLDFGERINTLLNPRYKTEEWDKAEFIEFEEQKGGD